MTVGGLEDSGNGSVASAAVELTTLNPKTNDVPDCYEDLTDIPRGIAFGAGGPIGNSSPDPSIKERPLHVSPNLQSLHQSSVE